MNVNILLALSVRKLLHGTHQAPDGCQGRLGQMCPGKYPLVPQHSRSGKKPCNSPTLMLSWANWQETN